MSRWIFVYNADSGWVSSALDWAHKLVSPQTYTCSLCRVTHGLWGPRTEWLEALRRLPDEKEFLHRDELASRYPGREVLAPSVWKVIDEGWELVVGPSDWASISDVARLLVRLESS